MELGRATGVKSLTDTYALSLLSWTAPLYALPPMQDRASNTLKGFATRHGRALALMGTWVLLLGCEQEEPKDPVPESSESKGATDKAPSEPGAPGSSVEKSADAGKAANQDKDCPGGKWHYAFGDMFLKTLVENNMKGAKLVKNEGQYVCELPKQKSGKATCEAVGGPVVTEVAVDQAGLAMTVRVEISGKSILDAEITEDKITFKNGDLKDLKMKVHATVGGQKIPFEADKFLSMVPSDDSQMAYECSGDSLKLKMEVEGVVTDWQTLKRIP